MVVVCRERAATVGLFEVFLEGFHESSELLLSESLSNLNVSLLWLRLLGRTDGCDLELLLVDLELFLVDLELFLVDLELFLVEVPLFPVDVESFLVDLELSFVNLELFAVDLKLFPIDLELFPFDLELFHRNGTRVGAFEVCVTAHVALRMFIMQILVSQLHFLANRTGILAARPLSGRSTA